MQKFAAVILKEISLAAVIVDCTGAVVFSSESANKLFVEIGQRLQPIIWSSRISECLARGEYETFCDHLLAFCRLKSITGPDGRSLVLITFSESQSTKPADYVDFHLTRLREMSEMAAGIAHEVNNPMTVIYSRAQILIDMLSSGEMVKPEVVTASLEKILKQAERVTKIIKGLRNFSRDASNDPKAPAKVSRLLNDTLALANASIRNLGVQVDIEMDEEGIYVNCREAEIIQVLLNLVNNAVGALGETVSPRILIKVEVDTHVRLSISDNGPGVPPDIENKIFLPFFSTKPIGVGTGIGLSIASRIVVSHGGRLFLNRQKSASCFEIEFPVYSAVAKAA
jgi:signal transduction histidine kinase